MANQLIDEDGNHFVDQSGNRLTDELQVAGTTTLSDYVLDFGFTVLDTQADKIYLCSDEPTNYTEATESPAHSPAGFALASKDFGAGAAFGSMTSSSSPDVPGRSVDSAAILDGSVTETGTVTFWAAVDSSNGRLLVRGPVAVSKSVTSGNTFTLPSFNLRMPGQ